MASQCSIPHRYVALRIATLRPAPHRNDQFPPNGDRQFLSHRHATLRAAAFRVTTRRNASP